MGDSIHDVTACNGMEPCAGAKLRSLESSGEISISTINGDPSPARSDFKEKKVILTMLG
jgi:hypothetical protein